MELLLSFLLAGFALAGSPGPNTLSLAATGAAYGTRRGLGYLTGIVFGMIAVMGIAATGVVSVLQALPGATSIIGIAAALYFLYLAFRIATAPPLGEKTAEGRQPSFAGGVFLSLVNPKGYAAMVALFSRFVLVRERPAVDVAAKMVVLTAVMVAVNLIWLVTGAALTRWFRDPVMNRAINVTFAVLLIASVAAALLL